MRVLPFSKADLQLAGVVAALAVVASRLVIVSLFSVEAPQLARVALAAAATTGPGLAAFVYADRLARSRSGRRPGIGTVMAAVAAPAIGICVLLS